VKTATWPRDFPQEERLLVVDVANARFVDTRVRSFPDHLRERDLVVLNDAATVPASLRCEELGLEVRLAQPLEGDGSRWQAVLLGAGDWRTRTEDRPAPPRLDVGREIRFGPFLSATVTEVSPISPRLLALRFSCSGAALWSALHRLGKPVQYAYVDRPLALWHVQTPYAERPWAVEMPSAGRPLAWEILLELRRRGVELARLTHAAGLSSTGDPAIDRELPLRESFDVPAETVEAVHRAKARGGRVVAIGTTVVRAIEGSQLRAGRGTTDLRIGPGFRPRFVDGLLTGIHERTASHFALLGAFAPTELLDRAYAHAERAGYLAHEFGDSCLVL
jgi:S-adenosylmethionine:tRNA ribosyltransferase-isomerase